MSIHLTINGNKYDVSVPPQTNLLSVLRNDLELTGSRYGCGIGVCGACYVLANDQAVASCTLSVKDAAGIDIVTVEGLATGELLHPVQQAFVDEDSMQCGYCTSGMLIAAVSLLKRSPHPSDEEIHDALGAHLCRCGVYMRAIRAVKRAAR
jgi:nicotinate dehydrogenase subunit A